MALEDIEKLKERIVNNPDSKLFVPLAEEYRKAGMFDEAVEVLKQGLELQPSYMSARVALGKIYLEKEMLEEAKSEFEEVIKTIPDNLFAHKKLAEIYKDLGDPISALKQYETVIGLNPLDDEAQISMESLADLAEAAKAFELESAVDEVSPEEELSAKSKKETVYGEETVEEIAKQENREEKIAVEEVAPEVEEVADEIPYPGKEELIKDSGKDLGEDFEQFKDSIQTDVKPSDETLGKSLSEKPVDEEDRETQMFYGGDSSPATPAAKAIDDAKESILPNDEEFFGEPVKEESILPDDEEFFDEPVKEESILPDDDRVPDEPVAKVKNSRDIVSELRHAEELVGQSKFSDAIKYYNGLIDKYPEDKKIIQKLRELKAYLKMLGKDKEGMINRLELLLNGIKLRKKKYEF